MTVSFLSVHFFGLSLFSLRVTGIVRNEKQKLFYFRCVALCAVVKKNENKTPNSTHTGCTYVCQSETAKGLVMCVRANQRCDKVHWTIPSVSFHSYLWRAFLRFFASFLFALAVRLLSIHLIIKTHYFTIFGLMIPRNWRIRSSCWSRWSDYVPTTTPWRKQKPPPRSKRAIIWPGRHRKKWKLRCFSPFRWSQLKLI